MLTGTHSAEQPRPRRWGQASMAALTGKTRFVPDGRRAVVRRDDTAADAVCVARSDQHLSEMGLAGIGEQQLGRQAGAASVSASVTRSKTVGSAVDISSAVAG